MSNTTASRLLANSSYEVTPHATDAIGKSKDILPQGAEVFVAHIPGTPYEGIVTEAARTRKAGFTPVPHLVARNAPSPAAFEEFLKQLIGEAQIDRALILAGDVDRPQGEWVQALDILRSGILQRNGITNVRISAYPEGHPKVPTPVLDQALRDKVKLCAETGLDATIVSQFAFEPTPIVNRIREIRAEGIDNKMRVGICGPASVTNLLKYAVKCGVGNSLKALRRPEMLANLLTKMTPADIVKAVADDADARGDENLIGFHFFSFGGLFASVNWAQESIKNGVR
jgi:methylenetetrahydrofolate reductase (NADPH)